MKKIQDIPQVLRQLRVSASSKLDERVYEEIAKAGAPAPTAASGPALTFGQLITLLLKKKFARYTLATTLGLIVLAVLVLNHSTSSAWAMEQAIETLKKYKALHITGYYTTAGGQTSPLDLWARSDTTGNLIEIGMVKVGSNITSWIKGNNTYTYDEAQKKAYAQPGINLFQPWFGPKLLAAVARVKDYKAVEGDDPATGQKRVIVTCSLENFKGPQSFLMEFDFRTKLPISMKIWYNLKREGTPSSDFEKIIYFEDLPDSAFSFQPPAGTQFADVPLWVPEANLSLLSDPKCGISADGMTQEQATQKLLGQFWDAAIRKDKGRIRQLCPVTASWSDEMLRGTGDPDVTLAQVLKIGGIEQTGRSRLGPLALVPSWLRSQDGTERELWLLVQFRETDHGTSCVVAAPHGYGLNLKE